MNFKLITLAAISTIALYFLNTASCLASNKPKIQLAKPYKESTNIQDYFISEKLDGIRGYWNGKQLLTRSGNIIKSPKFFTQGWPKQPLDGELWFQRQAFEETLSIVRKQIPNESQWRKMRFMVFDLPTSTNTFSNRIKALQDIVSHHQSAYLIVVEQLKVDNNEQLQKIFKEVVNRGGEGLMLHHQNARYKVGRNKHLMKLKPFSDAEAKVIAYIEGKGKYQGQLGAITVKTPNGIVFNIGSGFTDQERKKPPKIGSTVTFKYSGKTKRGVPRFATYLRVRYPPESM